MKRNRKKLIDCKIMIPENWEVSRALINSKGVKWQRSEEGVEKRLSPKLIFNDGRYQESTAVELSWKSQFRKDNVMRIRS